MQISEFFRSRGSEDGHCLAEDPEVGLARKTEPVRALVVGQELTELSLALNT